ncbi:hypothetical protein DFH29DRAFT_1015561 [Suillus ampliporus]|nr:hypothetical protein DFH29DRAFT_1015561 [Suillus ampliporus]
MPEQLTLYLLKVSPRSQKSLTQIDRSNWLLLSQPYKTYEVDLWNKPEWFTSKVNPVGKVPAVTYGGPDVNPEDPSPLSAKIAESNVILEFVADLYPDSGLMPKDPVQRANVHHFIDVTAKHIDDPFYAFLQGRELYDDVLKGIEFVQGLLKEAGYFAGWRSLHHCRCGISPYLARLKIVAETDLGNFPVGMGYKLGEELKGPKFAKFMKYVERMLERPSLKQIHDEESVITFYKKIFTERAYPGE